MRDLFELRVETVRLESEQRLQAKAQQEREALQAQLHNTQVGTTSSTLMSCPVSPFCYRINSL